MSRPAALAALAFLAAAAIFAQSADEPMRAGETISVGYVMVPFSVQSSKGQPITDLRPSEVTLKVDGVPVRSDMFEKAMNEPVSFTILLDGSGSMGLAGKMESARAAISTLLAGRKPGDDFALYVFDDKRAREVVAFTDDPQPILRALDRVKPYGKTAFFDALATMPNRSALGRNASRAIILLSDGIDNASNLTRRELASELQGVSVPIYPLGLREAAEARVPRPAPSAPIDEELSDIQLLEEVANLTGGRLYLGNEPEQLAAAVAGIERTLRAQYLIGFSPTGNGAVKYRRISLELAGRVRTVRVRAGYLGTEPPVLAAKKRNERKGS